MNTRHHHLRRTVLMVLLGGLAASVAPSHAGGRVSGVATEFTQIANYGLLGDQLKRAIETASNTLQTVTNLQRQLVTLPASALIAAFFYWIATKIF